MVKIEFKPESKVLQGVDWKDVDFGSYILLDKGTSFFIKTLTCKFSLIFIICSNIP